MEKAASSILARATKFIFESMRASLSFNLPEETEEHKTALNGWAYKGALQELDNWLRAKLKYEDLPEERSKAFQEARDKLHEFLKDDDISLF